MQDLIVHIVLFVFWFTGSSAWANAVNVMSSNMKEENIMNHNPHLHESVSQHLSFDSTPIVISVVSKM